MSSPAQEETATVREFNALGQQSSSPVQTKPQLDFPDALRAVRDGRKITRADWCDERIYVALNDNVLMIRKANQVWYILTVSEADMVAEDWIVI